MNTKYDLLDLETMSVDELCEKYGVSKATIKKALYRNGFRKHKKIKITSPYSEETYVADIQKCADELKVSRETVYRALRGEKVPTLDDLNIKVEYVEGDV